MFESSGLLAALSIRADTKKGFIPVTDWGHFGQTRPSFCVWKGAADTITGQEIIGSGPSHTRTVHMTNLGSLPKKKKSLHKQAELHDTTLFLYPPVHRPPLPPRPFSFFAPPE